MSRAFGSGTCKPELCGSSFVRIGLILSDADGQGREVGWSVVEDAAAR
jgi:hypothetical protein